MKTISIILILLSVIASFYYSFAGMSRPETLMVYNKANIPLWGIRLWASVLGISGFLLLFPQTFKLAGVLMIFNSLFTVVCFLMVYDWKGAFFELIFLLIPLFLLYNDYPLMIKR